MDYVLHMCITQWQAPLVVRTRPVHCTDPVDLAYVCSSACSRACHPSRIRPAVVASYDRQNIRPSARGGARWRMCVWSIVRASVGGVM